MILILVLQRATSNTLSVLAANFLRTSDAAFALTLPFYTSPSWGAGVMVRVMAAGNPGACDVLSSWSAQGFARGVAGGSGPPPSAWTYSVVPNCGDTGVAQHVFQCTSCSFTSSSALTMNFDWSCQALYVEAGALDASGSVSTDAISPALTMGSAGFLLSSVATYDGLYLNLVNDTYQSKSARGYALAPGSNPTLANTQLKTTTPFAGISYYYPNATLPAAALAACDGNTLCAATYDPSIVPNITLVLNLPLNTLYTINTLSEKTSVTALLSSIIGLTGIVGLFGQALRSYDRVHEKAGDIIKKRQSKRKIAASEHVPL